METCFIYRKHAAQEAAPPGGYLYEYTSLEGVPHFHSWLVPRRKDIPDHCLKFLARDDSGSDGKAATLAHNLPGTMASS